MKVFNQIAYLPAALLLTTAGLAVAEPAPDAPLAQDLAGMSIEQLGDIEIYSVSKTSQPLSDAPSAIFVITHDDIVRSGAVSIPEILRLAPNLHVAQTSASAYVITARGFSGNANNQNFSNKLLVLIDGRSVYTPLFSGVYWDMQDVLIEDIDHVEVISGPGATLWGANAVNGVINIITRKSADTQGWAADADVGEAERGASLRYGGKVGENFSYRLYAKGFFRGQSTTPATGAGAHDDWTRGQGGFRLDWAASPRDNLTLQGDAYQGDESQPGVDQKIAGRNLLARWNHTWQGGAALQAQVYYDRADRGSFVVDTFDLDVQHSFALGRRNQVVLGGGARVYRYATFGADAFHFDPAGRTLNLLNVFVQDSISINDATTLVVGLKLEDEPLAGVTPLPSARLSWKPSDAILVWGAISRSIRSATPFDRDVVEKIGPVLFLTGGTDFQSEKLTAYEVGVRVQPSPRLSFSVSGFYNVYDDLRSVEPTPVTLLPLMWGNGVKGRTAGVEAWGDFQVASWWRLSAAFTVLNKDLSFKPGDLRLVGLEQEGDDPANQASLKSSMNIGRAVTFDADLRYVGALPNPLVPAYTELNARVAWNVNERVELSLNGRNLLHDYHQEFPAANATAVPRSVFAAVRLRY